jgi:tetratricopeptide (TPR) repeat protein
MKHFTEGLAFCEARLIQDPQNVNLWRLKTLLLSEDMKAYSAALPSALQCVQLVPANADNWNLLGWVQLNCKDYEAALASFERALAINPSYVVALRNKALALRRLGQLNEALTVLAQAARLDPKGYRQWGRSNWRNWRFWFIWFWRALAVASVILAILAYFGFHGFP